MTVVLQSESGAWDASGWQREVNDAGALLRQAHTRVLATLLDNGPAFVALDEAALGARVVHVPLPPFFTTEQLGHALDAAGVDTIAAHPLLAERWPQAPAADDWRRLTYGEGLASVQRVAAAFHLGLDLVKGAAGHELRKREVDDHDPEQRRNDQQQPPKYIGTHDRCLPRSRP